MKNLIGLLLICFTIFPCYVYSSGFFGGGTGTGGPETDPLSIHLDGSTSPSANIDWNGFSIIGLGDLISDVTGTYDLGTAANKWRNVYISDFGFVPNLQMGTITGATEFALYKLNPNVVFDISGGTPTSFGYKFLAGAKTYATLDNLGLEIYTLKLDGSTSGVLTVNPAAVTTSYSLTMPAAQGAASTVLQNDGSGVLSWATAGGGGDNFAGADRQIQFNDGAGVPGTDADITWLAANTLNISGVTGSGINVTGTGSDIGFHVNNTGASGHDWSFNSTNSGSGGGAGLFSVYDNTSDYTALWAFSDGASTGKVVLSPAGATPTVIKAIAGAVIVGSPTGNKGIKFVVDKDGDIGDISSHRPRTIYPGTNILAPDQDVSTPPYSFSSNTDLGFYRSGSNQVSVTNAGVETWRLKSNGRLAGQVAGGGIDIKEGSNARLGQSTCNGVTEVSVSNTSVTATTRIFLQIVNTGGAPVSFPYVSSQTASTSFGFKCGAADTTSTVNWLLVEPS